jgi:hypothetical protein
LDKTFTSVLAEAVHPFESVTKTVYEVVDKGVTVGVESDGAPFVHV